MNLYQLLFILGLILSSPVTANENPACGNNSISFTNHNANELRIIAASCQDKEVARLFYNRAYHKDLLLEGKALSSIIQLNAEPSHYLLTAYRMYIAMLEEFAPLYYPDIQQRVKFLNMIYERRSEVVELRLHGYDKLADALERKILF